MSICIIFIFYKVLIIVFLDVKKNFVVVGFDVEIKFLEFVEEEEVNNLYYFWRFKMIFYDKLRDGKEVWFYLI